jgi:hypothetical protein
VREYAIFYMGDSFSKCAAVRMRRQARRILRNPISIEAVPKRALWRQFWNSFLPLEKIE